MITIVLLQKEQIPAMRFANNDVLDTPMAILARQKSMERALILGNNEHIKVRITFMDFTHSLYEVETTVWALTEDSICLKGHIYLPKKAILALD